MSDGFRPRTPQTRAQAEVRAPLWRQDDRMDDLIALRERDRSAYLALGPRIAISVGLYESARDHHAALNERFT